MSDPGSLLPRYLSFQGISYARTPKIVADGTDGSYVRCRGTFSAFRNHCSGCQHHGSEFCGMRFMVKWYWLTQLGNKHERGSHRTGLRLQDQKVGSNGVPKKPTPPAATPPAAAAKAPAPAPTAPGGNVGPGTVLSYICVSLGTPSSSYPVG